MFHYIFPPLTIGLGWLIFWMMLTHLRTGDERYRDMARFWTKVFALSFAVGVATGITMEFQFGTNWADYSRFVGDIFGPPLAAEGVFAFFLESSFLGLLLFGEKRLTAKMHTLAAFFVAFGATLSAFWIIVANSWQQTPAGYEINNGRAELTSFFEAVFNPSTIPRFTHTIAAAIITGAFFVLGISAIYLLRKKHVEFARRSFRMALIAAFIFSLAQAWFGHHHAIQVAQTQPAKLAAFEGLFETQTRAPLLLFGIPNVERMENDYEIAVPGMLSFLVDMSLDHEVQGLNDFPREEWPPVLLTFIPFHAMFGLGLVFIGFSTLGVFLLWRKKIGDDRSTWLNTWYLRLAVAATPFPIIANELGWLAAEAGRQPWVVYGLVRTADGISQVVPSAHLIFSLVMFTLMYSLLLGLWLFLLRNKLRAGPKWGTKGEQEVGA
jgi:cytochrome d ubiquinol oxidase subunit I